ncbi:hypothetical protein PCE1_004911 [Barthelona sp. PCE]
MIDEAKRSLCITILQNEFDVRTALVGLLLLNSEGMSLKNIMQVLYDQDPVVVQQALSVLLCFEIIQAIDNRLTSNKRDRDIKYYFMPDLCILRRCFSMRHDVLKQYYPNDIEKFSTIINSINSMGPDTKTNLSKRLENIKDVDSVITMMIEEQLLKTISPINVNDTFKMQYTQDNEDILEEGQVPEIEVDNCRVTINHKFFVAKMRMIMLKRFTDTRFETMVPSQVRMASLHVHLMDYALMHHTGDRFQTNYLKESATSIDYIYDLHGGVGRMKTDFVINIRVQDIINNLVQRRIPYNEEDFTTLSYIPTFCIEKTEENDIIIQYKELVEYWRISMLRRIISDIYGDVASRICGLFMRQTSQKFSTMHVEKLIVASPNESTARLNLLFADGLINRHVFSQSSEHAPKETAYLWSSSEDQIVSAILGRLYHCFAKLETKRYDLGAGDETVRIMNVLEDTQELMLFLQFM